MIRYALDTNILIYNHLLDDVGKRSIAHELLTHNPVVSTQAVSEYLNVMKRLLPISKAEILKLCAEWMQECKIKSVDGNTVRLAERLVSKYDFQIFDAIIIASALEAGCRTLYTEDLQHNMVIERTLTVVYPFL
jgi:predicted nucleic acid-binding protein